MRGEGRRRKYSVAPMLLTGLIVSILIGNNFEKLLLRVILVGLHSKTRMKSLEIRSKNTNIAHPLYKIDRYTT